MVLVIQRNLLNDVAHSRPLDELEAARREVAADPRVWHALLLPCAVAPDGRFVLTGHIVCHDCALCEVAGDLRDGGQLVPWRARYPDCTSTEEEILDYTTCTDDVVGRVQMPLWVIEAFHAGFFTGAQGTQFTGWQLAMDRMEALEAWGLSLPASAASRMPAAYLMVDSLVTTQGVPLPAAVYLPPSEEHDPQGEHVTAIPPARAE